MGRMMLLNSIVLAVTILNPTLVEGIDSTFEIEDEKFTEHKTIIKGVLAGSRDFTGVIIKPSDVAVALFESANASLAIQFGSYHNMTSLEKAITSLDRIKSASTKNFSLDGLFALPYSKTPTIVLIMKHVTAYTKYTGALPPTGLQAVPKILVFFNFDPVWKDNLHFKDNIKYGSGVDETDLLDSIRENSALLPILSSLPKCLLPSSAPIFSAAPTHEPYSTMLSMTSQYQMTSSTLVTPSALKTATQVASVTNPSQGIISPSASSGHGVTSSIINEGREEVLNGVKKEYYQIINYNASKIDYTNETSIKEFIVRSANLIRNLEELQSGLQETNLSSMSVLVAIEQYCFDVAYKMGNSSTNKTIRISTSNMVIAFGSVAVATFEGFQHGNLETDWGSVVVPRDAISGWRTKGFARIMAMIVDPLYEFQSAKQTDSDKNSKLSSRIIAVTVDPPPTQPLTKPIVITVRNNKTSNNSEMVPKCVFWDTKRRGWSSSGCHLSFSNATITECKCDHMTNYAVLMSIGDMPIPAKHTRALSIVTYIGCTLSILGVFLTVVTLISLPVLRSERTRIHCNLCIAVGVSQILFLAGGTEELVESKVGCKLYAALMFYAFMSVFSWMLVEGIHLYQMIIIAFITRAMMKFYYFIGWGLPMCIVVIASCISHKGYGTPNFCWLSLTDHTIWAFTGPAIVVILVNAVVLGAVLRLRTKLENNAEVSHRVKTGARVSIMLLPLLGLSWIFGLFTAMEGTLVIQYIFAATNSLQGLMIFAFHCVGNSEVRKEFHRKTSHWTLMRTLSSASSSVTPATQRTDQGISMKEANSSRKSC
ncbi:adhesion G protein-coupled receptor L4 isoform X2 [Nematostella vectensis]|uniref:adhesion G protein-coupled receptor L4 isoform X2 n=1 Tax=Nematostella vectensis TaxID=45351 RepID=UPI002076EA25|nr:adhesion G protein-coupled receptor L4 isoform X2 [Nematostella vectensis]